MVTGIKKAQENERMQLPQSIRQLPKQSAACALPHGQATSNEWRTSATRELSPRERGFTQSPVARVVDAPTGDPEARRETGCKPLLAMR